ncbi:hypothetical protein T484DRAFT_1856626, partial [Baffinella frigidus]
RTARKSEDKENAGAGEWSTTARSSDDKENAGVGEWHTTARSSDDKENAGAGEWHVRQTPTAAGGKRVGAYAAGQSPALRI